MNTYDFIFSDQPRNRISRHVFFWLSWFLFSMLTIHFPKHIFPDWNMEDSANVIKMGGGLRKLLRDITYRQFMLLLNIILFTYLVIYYLLPRFFDANKSKIKTFIMSALIVGSFLVVHYFIVHFTLTDSNKTKISRGVLVTPTTHIKTMAFLISYITLHVTTVTGLAICIKLLKRWWLKQRETELMIKEKANAELQLLKAQIHPHFLFNALNNIYSFAMEGSMKAPEMIQKLTGLLHYMLHGCKQPVVPLEKELMMIQDYISLEKIRYGDRLKIDVNIKQDDKKQKIAPLLLIPFVENSFKHGTSKMLANPRILLNITVQHDEFYFKLENSQPTEIEDVSVNGNRGLGLKNVKKRLSLLYPNKHDLQILDEPTSYTVWLKIALTEMVIRKKEIAKQKQSVYDMA